MSNYGFVSRDPMRVSVSEMGRYQLVTVGYESPVKVLKKQGFRIVFTRFSYQKYTGPSYRSYRTTITLKSLV